MSLCLYIINHSLIIQKYLSTQKLQVFYLMDHEISEYKEELKDPTLAFRGSTNQRIIELNGIR